jgi:hypothetical protein
MGLRDINMLLQELAGVKRFQKYEIHQLFKIFRRLGVKTASGKFGTVFMHPSWNYVYKVVDGSDPEYAHFVNYVLQHPNKHFPKFVRKPLTVHKFHTRNASDANTWWIVKIEKLDEITDIGLLKFIVYNLESGMAAVYSEAHGSKDALEYRHKNHAKMMPDGEYHNNVSMGDIFEQYPWFKTLSEAAAHYNAYDEDAGVNDIHGGNFMQRKDGTVVFIDPSWAGTSPYQLEREYMAGYRDMADDFDDVQMVTGPRTPKKEQARKDAEKVQAEKSKQQRATMPQSDMEDDIPF